jgi:hypothetical protein
MGYVVIQCHVPEDWNPHPYRWENLKIYVFSVDVIYGTVTSCTETPYFPQFWRYDGNCTSHVKCLLLVTKLILGVWLFNNLWFTVWTFIRPFVEIFVIKLKGIMNRTAGIRVHFREAISSSASQEISRIVWKLKAHSRVHKSCHPMVF